VIVLFSTSLRRTTRLVNMQRRNNKSKGKPRRNPRNRYSDVIRMHGKETFVTINSATTSGNTPINGTSTNIAIRPSTLSNRIVQVSDAFARYRFKYMKVQYKSHCSSTTQGAIAIGLVDDADNSDVSGNVNTFTAVTNLRTNMDGSLWKNMTMIWKPVDPDKWYYTDSAGEDIRFVQPATLVALFDVARTDNLLLGDIRVQYLIEFEGGRPVYVNNLKAVAKIQESSSDGKRVSASLGGVIGSPLPSLCVSDMRNCGVSQAHKFGSCTGCNEGNNCINMKQRD